MQLRLALAEEDCEQNTAQRQAYAGDSCCGKLFAKHRPSQQRGNWGVEGKQDSRAAWPNPIETGEQQRIANEDADETG